jgi:hypothetical protein
METLRLVDVADDGQLVLMSRDGTRYLLPVDAEVRAAVRRDRVRPAEEERLDRPGPREVQARIRAGADAHEVAAATGLELEYVRRFEGPVLAERRHVAELARSLPVHRDPGARPASLETVVLAALTDAGHDPDRVSWDSHRVEGTRWDVEVFSGAGGDPADGPVRATWRIDVATRALEEVDDAARRLTALERRRLSPVRDRVFDIEAGRSRRQQAPAADPGASTTASILEALALQRGRRPGEARGDDRPHLPAGSPAAAAAPARHEPDERDEPEAPTGPPPATPSARAHPAPRAAQVTPLPHRPVAADDDRPGPPGDHGSEVAADADVPGTDGPAIEPSLLGELDLDQPEPAPPAVRPGRSGRNARTGPRTVAVPPTAAQRTPPGPRSEGFREDPREDPRNGGPPAAAVGEPPGDEADAPAPVGTPAVPEPSRPEPPREPVAARRGAKRRRAAVPSWDDIVFGARVDDE